MAKHPPRQPGPRPPRVRLYLIPVRVLEQLGVAEAKLLRARVPDEAQADVGAYGLRDAVPPPADVQTRRQGDGILDGLRCAVC